MGDSMYLMWGGVGYGLFYVFDVPCGEGEGGWELDDSIYFQFYFQHSTIYAESNNMSICCHYIATIMQT